jgi:hypothetical protein
LNGDDEVKVDVDVDVDIDVLDCAEVSVNVDGGHSPIELEKVARTASIRQYTYDCYCYQVIR